jgi:hypothetical protein
MARWCHLARGDRETTVTPSMQLAKHEPGANHDLDRKAKGNQAPEPIPNQTLSAGWGLGVLPVPCHKSGTVRTGGIRLVVPRDASMVD